MESKQITEIKNKLDEYKNKIERSVENNQIRDLFKRWSVGTIETLSAEEGKKIKSDFEKALFFIDNLLDKKPTLMLFISKSEILTCLSLISKKIGQMDSAIKFSKRAIEANNLINAFISVEADWDFLEFTFEDLDRALKIKGISIGGAATERMHKNLPLLIEYYHNLGDKETEEMNKKRFATIRYGEGRALLE